MTMGRSVLISMLLALFIPFYSIPAQEQSDSSTGAEGRILLGAREMVFVSPPGVFLEGRIDTGAALSSVHASDISWFFRDGNQWVRFNMDFDGTDRVMEEPVLSVMRVVQAGNPSGSERPVVSLKIRIGSLETEAEFTITDRSSLSSPVLIGRNILAGKALVDVSSDFIQSVSP